MTHTEFLRNFPVTPREFAIVLDAIPKSVWFLPRTVFQKNLTWITCGKIFIDNVEVLKQQCSNKVIRNALCFGVLICGKSFIL